MKFILASLKAVIFLIFIVTSSSLLFFSVIEVFPALLDQVNLDKIRYYAHKRRNIADDELGYRPREENFTINRVFNGDLFGFDPVLTGKHPFCFCISHQNDKTHAHQLEHSFEYLHL